MTKTFQIRKITSPKAENYGNWVLTVGEVGYLGMIDNVKVLFEAETRKKVKDYAEQNNITIDYIDSGRTYGCRW